MGCWRAYARDYHWTPDQVMAMTFDRFHRFAFGAQKFTLTRPGEAAATMEDLRDQINRRRAEKNLPPMKPAPS